MMTVVAFLQHMINRDWQFDVPKTAFASFFRIMDIKKTTTVEAKVERERATKNCKGFTEKATKPNE